MSLYKLLIIATYLLSVPVTSLYADEKVELLQFTCRPEYDFFSVRSMRLENTISYKKENEKEWKVLKNDANDPEIQKKAEEQSFYTVNKVREKPYVCELDDRHISVEIINYEGYDGNSGCTSSPKFDVQVYVDGNPIHTFSGLGAVPCMSNENHEVSIRGEELQDCKLGNPFSIGDMECSKIVRPEQLKSRP